MRAGRPPAETPSVWASWGANPRRYRSAEIADVTDGIVTLTYQDAAGHWCAVAIRASWADDAAAQHHSHTGTDHRGTEPRRNRAQGYRQGHRATQRRPET